MKGKAFFRWETLFGLLLAGWGSLYHLRLTQAWSDPHLLGDRGDGYLMFYLLEHVRRFFTGEGGTLADVPMFWPDQGTLWWSDNFILPGMVHAILTSITGSPATSAHVSVAFWTFLGFVSAWWFFSELLTACRTDQENAFPRFMGCIPPVLAYVVMFSICRLQTLSHFHNLAAIFLILLITCAFRHLRFGRTLDLVGMAAPECAMLYFSPYQALLGVVVLSAWGGLQLTVLSPERLKRLMIQACATVPFVGASAWISLQYARVEPREYNLYEFSSRAASLGNYLRPLGTGKDAAWLPTVFPGGYLGAGLLLGGLLVTLALVWRVRNRIHFLVIQRPLWIGIGLLALSLIDARELRPFTVWLRFLAYLYPFGWLVWWLRQNPERDRMLHWIFLGASCVLVVGVSAGPMMYFEDHALDPGIWGWYQHLVPGFGSMRELMRFTATGQFLILACVVSVACTMLKRPALVLGLGGVCLLLQLVEMNGAQPKMIRAASIPPMTEIETAFWEKQQGVLVAFPCAPFHENTRWLLRFQHLPELVLMNGYSGRSSDLLDRLMALESGKGTATPQAVQEAFSSGATYVYILKRTVEPARLQQIRKIQPVVYESRSFLVLGKSNP